MESSDTCDKSRRKLLKKAYEAPVIVTLGTMALASPVVAMSKRGGGGHYSAGSQSQTQGGTKTQKKDDTQTQSGSSSLHPKHDYK